MIYKPPPFLGLNIRMPIMISAKGRAFINEGSTLLRNNHVIVRGIGYNLLVTEVFFYWGIHFLGPRSKSVKPHNTHQSPKLTSDDGHKTKVPISSYSTAVAGWGPEPTNLSQTCKNS